MNLPVPGYQAAQLELPAGVAKALRHALVTKPREGARFGSLRGDDTKVVLWSPHIVDDASHDAVP